jgi:hypothetical protein
MALPDDIERLATRTLSALDASHDYYTTRNACGDCFSKLSKSAVNSRHLDEVKANAEERRCVVGSKLPRRSSHAATNEEKARRRPRSGAKTY